jgi:hypothetical protein
MSPLSIAAMIRSIAAAGSPPKLSLTMRPRGTAQQRSSTALAAHDSPPSAIASTRSTIFVRLSPRLFISRSSSRSDLERRSIEPFGRPPRLLGGKSLALSVILLPAILKYYCAAMVFEHSTAIASATRCRLVSSILESTRKSKAQILKTIKSYVTNKHGINFTVETYNSSKQHSQALTGRRKAMKKPIRIIAISAVAALPAKES